jgi:hypothetical protein
MENRFLKYKTNLSRKLSSVGRNIALYMQVNGVQTPIIPLIHLMDEIFSHWSDWTT